MGWVERSDTHRFLHGVIDGFRCASPILRHVSENMPRRHSA
jgi:hypothetical protein